jgi:hypothetical protein
VQVIGRAGLCVASLGALALAGCGSDDDSDTTAASTTQRLSEGFEQANWTYSCVNAKTPPFCTGNRWPDLEISVDVDGGKTSQGFGGFQVVCPNKQLNAFRVDDGERTAIVDGKFKVEGVWYLHGRSIGKAGVISGTQSADQKSMTVSWSSEGAPCIGDADNQVLKRTLPPS